MNKKTVLSFTLFVVGALTIWHFSPMDPVTHYGIWSLLPAVITIFICFISRNVILALFLGILAGGLVVGKINIINAFLIPSLGSEKICANITRLSLGFRRITWYVES